MSTTNVIGQEFVYSADTNFLTASPATYRILVLQDFLTFHWKVILCNTLCYPHIHAQNLSTRTEGCTSRGPLGPRASLGQGGEFSRTSDKRYSRAIRHPKLILAKRKKPFRVRIWIPRLRPPSPFRTDSMRRVIAQLSTLMTIVYVMKNSIVVHLPRIHAPAIDT